MKDDKGEYLAKFASFKDRLDVVSLEAAAMELSRMSGIETADTRLMPLGKEVKCLLVRRFDINEQGGRNHLISMQSLIKYFGIKRRQQAMGIIEEVHVAVSKWTEVFSQYNVPEKDVERLGKDIGQRLNLWAEIK